jgi:hypothetical protein
MGVEGSQEIFAQAGLKTLSSASQVARITGMTPDQIIK